jgi:broad specificity phosphatase PhoE
MRVIEHRRHTMRVKPGHHLSQAGVELARAVGEGLGPFDLVITSTLPRAFETAIAMGFAVHEQWAELASLPDAFEEEVPWDAGFAGLAAAVRHRPDGVAARCVRELAGLHRAIAGRLPEGGRALVISHGAIVEASAVGCRPDWEYALGEPACNYCEGVRLYFQGTLCERVEVLRVPPR